MASQAQSVPIEMALSVIGSLRSRGHKAYLVGGCVRDRLLGLPAKDFDIGTDAEPQQVIVYFPGAQTVGAHFGVVLVKQDHAAIEVATFRSENSYSDGRRPDSVTFEKDPRLDALRRDFTINGLFEDPLTGEVIDYVSGQQDLRNKLIRAIGDPERRFREDHLRMLRAVRFAARLDFDIEPETKAAIRRLAPQIARIAPERIRDEIVRILTEGGASRGFKLLDEAQLLDHVLPEVKALQGVEQPPESHPEGDVWTHVLMMLKEMDAPSATLAVGVLLHDIGKPKTFRRAADRIRFDGHAEVGVEVASPILERLRFSKDESLQILSLIANHMKFKDLLQMRQSTLIRFLRTPRFDEHLELHRLDCLASNGYTAAYEFAQASLAELSAQQIRPPRLVTGDDLIEDGFRPGPQFSTVLEAVETAQLEGEISSKEEGLAYARRMLAQSSASQL